MVQEGGDKMNKFRMRTSLYTYEVCTDKLPEAYDGMNLGNYETMIQAYKGEWLNYTMRYDTEDEAIKGHIEAIQYVIDIHRGVVVEV